MQFIKCLHPRFINNPYTHEPMAVPCGKCESCLSVRQSLWVTRLTLEAKHWKHVVFFTLTYNNKFLPRLDLRVGLLDDESLLSPIKQCDDFCNFHDYQIPCVSVRDIQLFIKRLRKNLCKHETVKEKKVLRYFISSEYGPTTFRPHYHGLLFFSSDWLAGNIRECICKAWSHYNPCSHSFSSIGISDVQFVQSDAAQYVAGYSSFVSFLPPILQHKKLRPFSLHSSQPPIGFADFTHPQIQEIFNNGLTRFAYKSPVNNRVVDVPLWRTFENKLFPKIKGFNQLNTYERIALYGIASILPEEVNVYGFYKFLSFHSIWSDYDSYFRLLVYKLVQELYGTFDNFDLSSFSRLLQISRHVLTMCNYFNCTLSYYVSRIELHYQNADYDCLVKQLVCEEEYMTHVPSYPLKYLPYLIDPLFRNNSRKLSLSARLHYLKCFGISDNEEEPLLSDTEQYKSLFLRVHSYYDNSHKTRIKNEYVENHPEIKTLLYTISKL